MGEDYEKYPVVHHVIKVPLNHKGKTLKEIIGECYNPMGSQSLEEIMVEDRFKIVSITDKAFIIAFDKAMNEIGYDFGGTISGNRDLMGIIYGKIGTKSRPCPARIHIENAPAHIMDLFTNGIANVVVAILRMENANTNALRPIQSAGVCFISAILNSLI